MTDRQGYIEREWRYDLGAHMPPPTDILEINLNRSINFEFHDRGDMRIKFLHEGVSHELNAGLRPKREGTYLDHRWVGPHLLHCTRTRTIMTTHMPMPAVVYSSNTRPDVVPIRILLHPPVNVGRPVCARVVTSIRCIFSL